MCVPVRADVFAAIDGELDPATLGAMDGHLAACATCRDRLKSDVAFLRAVRGAVSLEIAPLALRTRVALLLLARATAIAPA